MSSTSFELRPPSLDDLPGLVQFFANVRAAGGAGMTDGQLRDQLTSKRASIAENYRIAVRAGVIAGWLSVWHPGPASERMFFAVEADPRDAAVYEVLLDWAEERARVLADGRAARMHAGAASDDEPLAGLLRDGGYELVRHFFTMEIDLTGEPAQPVWPVGVGNRTFRAGDERAVYDGVTEAFEDHWDSFTVPFEDWREYFLESSEFDPELWFLAEDGAELAGFSLCWPERRPHTGHVNVLGVRWPWRRRGLATALLLHSFHEFRRRGRAKVDLNVDGESLTGAVALYERAGMRVVRRSDSYRKELR